MARPIEAHAFLNLEENKMDWLNANWTDVIFIVTAVISIASVIAKLTPTKVDDNIVGKIIVLMDKLALNNKPTTKE